MVEESRKRGVSLRWELRLKKWEGFSAAPYKDPAGLWTIGYGHLIGDGKTEPVGAAAKTISRGRAEEILRQDMYEKGVVPALRLSPILLNVEEDRLSAIADFIFNIGPAKYAKSTLRRRVNSGDWAEAAKENRKWVYGGGKVLPGLEARRRITSAWLEHPGV